MPKVKLNDVAVECKETIKGETGLPVVGLEHLIPSEVSLTQWSDNSDNTFTKRFRKGQVLFGRRRAYLKKAAVAPFDGICSGDITVIAARPDVLEPELLPFIIQNDALFDYARQAPTISNDNIDQTLVIVVPNSTDYGGICQMWESGAAIAFCPKSTYGYPLDTRGVIQHEAGGHGFGKLGDEYIYHNAFIDFCPCTCCDHDISGPKSIGWYDNLEMTGKMHEVGWSHLIFDSRYSDIVDIFEGGYMHSRGVFRSEQNSCMNNDIPYYSTISRESIVKRIKRYAGEEFSFEDFVAHDSREQAPAETRSIGGTPWEGHRVHHHQHTPVIHKGSPRK